MCCVILFVLHYLCLLHLYYPAFRDLLFLSRETITTNLHWNPQLNQRIFKSKNQEIQHDPFHQSYRLSIVSFQPQSRACSRAAQPLSHGRSTNEERDKHSSLYTGAIAFVLGYHILHQLLRHFRVWMRAINSALYMLCIQPGQ